MTLDHMITYIQIYCDFYPCKLMLVVKPTIKFNMHGKSPRYDRNAIVIHAWQNKNTFSAIENLVEEFLDCFELLLQDEKVRQTNVLN